MSKRDRKSNNDKNNKNQKNSESCKPDKKPEKKPEKKPDLRYVRPLKKCDFLKKEFGRKPEESSKKTPRKKTEQVNVEPSELDEYLNTLNKVGDNLCKLYARCWSTATCCYERQFLNRDKEDRETMIAIAGDLFINCVEAFETQCREDEEGEEDWE